MVVFSQKLEDNFSVQWQYEIIVLPQILVMVCRLIINVLKVLKFLATQHLKHPYAIEVSSNLAPVQWKKGVDQKYNLYLTTWDGWAFVKG